MLNSFVDDLMSVKSELDNTCVSRKLSMNIHKLNEQVTTDEHSTISALLVKPAGCFSAVQADIKSLALNKILPSFATTIAFYTANSCYGILQHAAFFLCRVCNCKTRPIIKVD